MLVVNLVILSSYYQNVKQDMILEDITGKPVKAIDVFALSIEALKNHLISALETQGTEVKPSEIQWVLTVPAIWTDNAKQFVRTSAEMVSRTKVQILVEQILIYKFKESI